MTEGKLLETALTYASHCHSEQIDRDGKPHIFHCIAVAMPQKTLEGKITALLHDAVEDCAPDKREKVEREIRSTFGEQILENVLLLTRTDEMSWSEHIRNCTKKEVTAWIKLYDIEHNTHPMRMDLKAAKKMPMYIEGYSTLCRTLGITRFLNV